MASAHIRSAFMISDDIRHRIVEKVSHITKKQLDITVEEDKELLGGLTIRVGNTIYDFSLKNKLANLKQTLLKK